MSARDSPLSAMFRAISRAPSRSALVEPDTAPGPGDAATAAARAGSGVEGAGGGVGGEGAGEGAGGGSGDGAGGAVAASAPAAERVVEAEFGEEEVAEKTPTFGEAAPAEGGADDSEGARLIALNMALNGTPREETERYLAENFQLADPAGLLDEVYASVEG